MLGKTDLGTKGVILECVPSASLERLKNGSHRDAHLRNCYEIYKRFGCNIIFSDSQIMYYADRGDLEWCCISYGSFYAPHKACKRLMDRNPNCRYYWLTNEYNIQPPGYAYSKKASVEAISNFDPRPNHGYKKWHTINLNTLLMKKPIPQKTKKFDVIYYGTFRPDRNKYFRRYLQKGVHLSTNSKNLRKYKHIGCDASWCKSLSWESGRETLSLFRYSLYIEDEHTHTTYNHLANRFYEALFCNVVILFCRSCENTIRKSGLEMDEDFMVSNHEELMKKVKDGKWEERLAFQKRWITEALEEKEEVLDNLGIILSGKDLPKATAGQKDGKQK